MMYEDLFQVFRKVGKDYEDIIASDMTIDNAMLFVRAWFQENFNDQVTSIEIRRQPMDYVAKTAEVRNEQIN